MCASFLSNCKFEKSDFPRLSLTQYRPAMPFGNRKKNVEVLLSLVLSQFKKYPPSGNLKFNNSGVFKAWNRIFWWKNPFNFSYAEFHSKYLGLLRVNIVNDN